jgi:PAS domain S-box-containing protein
LMSPVTASGFLLLGLALLGIDWRTRQGGWPSQFLSLSAGAIAIFGILSFAFDPRIYQVHLSLALPTAVTLAVLSLGLVCARTEWGLGSLLCSQTLGGSLARRLLPAASIPVLVGWIRWKITENGLHSEWSIVVLVTLLTMTLLAGLIGWAAVVVDRSDREQGKTELALRESQDRQAGIIGSAMDAIITVDTEQCIVLFNAAAETMFRCSSAEALGQPIARFIPQRFHAAHTGHIRKFGETGVTNRTMGTLGALWAARADGEEFQIEASISQIVTRGKKLFTVILRDVTERVQAEAALARQAAELARSEQALRAQTRMFQSVLDSMDEGLVSADQNGKFLLWNTAAKKIVGMGAIDLPAEQWSAHYGCYLPDGVTPFPTDQLPLVRAIRGEAADVEMFVRNRHRTEGVWIEATGRPLKDENGVMRGGVVAFRDVTGTRAAEREIRRLNDELEQRVIQRTAQLEAANYELESFTYSVSHDLRAPLRHIGGFSKILVEEFGPTLDSTARHYLQRIEEGTRRMGLLVDELLNLARLGRHSLSLQVTGLNSIAQEIVSILKPETEGRQVEWNIGDLPYVECDPVLMKQVLQNLMANALKFTRPRPRALIEVGQIDKNGHPAIFVRDNGVGFSMKYSGKLFGVFQRLHRSEDFEGTGIGLATVQRIIQKHGGRIWVEAELDRGATFYFTVGVQEQPQQNSNAAMAGA